jgi:hypothetical protein
MGTHILGGKKIPDWLIVLVWFVLSLGIFFSGHLYSNDAVSKIESATNLILHGSFEVSGYDGAWGIPAADGKSYPQFSLGSILMMVPPVCMYESASVLAGRPLPEFVRSALVSGLNLVYTALSGTLFFIMMASLGKKRREAFIYANILIFCSEMVQYSTTGWSEPAALCWGLLGCTFYTAGKKNVARGNSWVCWAVCAFFASLIRIEFIVFFLSLWGIDLWYSRKEWRSRILPVCIVCSVVLAHAWFNRYRFGSMVNFGYFGRGAENEPSMVSAVAAGFVEMARRFFSGVYCETFFMTFLSFGRVHWFWVCPLIVAVPAGLWIRKYPAIAGRIAGAAGIMQFVVVAMGPNSWCWANRYLYTSIPFLLLPVFFIPTERKRIYLLFVMLCAVGLVVSLAGTVVNYHFIQELAVERYGYSDAMWGSAVHVLAAPVWAHLQKFPGCLMRTAALAGAGNAVPAWETLRTAYLALWPVSLSGAGVHPTLAFCFWILWVLLPLGFGAKIVAPAFFREV